MDPRRCGKRYVCVRVYWVVTDMVCAGAEEVYKLEILRRLEAQWEIFQRTKNGGFAEKS